MSRNKSKRIRKKTEKMGSETKLTKKQARRIRYRLLWHNDSILSDKYAEKLEIRSSDAHSLKEDFEKIESVKITAWMQIVDEIPNERSAAVRPPIKGRLFNGDEEWGRFSD
jgi:hypothetical protein